MLFLGTKLEKIEFTLNPSEMQTKTAEQSLWSFSYAMTQEFAEVLFEEGNAATPTTLFKDFLTL